jgi:hypothetical protein
LHPNVLYRQDELTAAEFERILGADPVFQSKTARMDSGMGPFLARSLEQFLTKEYQVPLQDLPITSGTVVDIATDVDEWAKTFTSTIVDGSGIAEFYNDYAQSSIPMATISTEEFTRKVANAALGYELSVFDQGFEGFAARNGRPLRLRDRLNQHAVRGMLEKAERTMMWGDAARDLYGFGNHPNVPVCARGAGPWTTASGEEIVADITNMEQSIRDATNCTREPNALAIPESIWRNWTRPYTSTSGPTVVTQVSVRQSVQDAFPQLTIFPLCRLQANQSFGNLSVDTAVMYRRDEEAVRAIFPMRPRFESPQMVELMIKVPGYCRFGGIDWIEPATACTMAVGA